MEYWRVQRDFFHWWFFLFIFWFVDLPQNQARQHRFIRGHLWKHIPSLSRHAAVSSVFFFFTLLSHQTYLWQAVLSFNGPLLQVKALLRVRIGSQRSLITFLRVRIPILDNNTIFTCKDWIIEIYKFIWEIKKKLHISWMGILTSTNWITDLRNSYSYK